MAQVKETPAKYKQPIREYIGRSLLEDSTEEVDYVPKSHVRIWYNNQTERYATHHHDAMEIILCVENSYTVIANHQTYKMNVGDILMIPPHMLHKIICDSDGARFIFLFNLDLFSELEDYSSLSPLFMDAYFCSAASRPNIYQEVYASFMNMVDIYFSNDIFWEINLYSILMKCLSLIGKDHFFSTGGSTDVVTNYKQRLHYEKFVNLLNYIDSNYKEDLTLEQVANYIGFSKYHFSRLFKQHTNTTFYDYLSHKRIQAAQALLTMDIPITDIAFQTGFNNLTTFCRCFKKVTNCSPSEYRNKFRTDQV